MNMKFVFANGRVDYVDVEALRVDSWPRGPRGGVHLEWRSMSSQFTIRPRGDDTLFTDLSLQVALVGKSIGAGAKPNEPFYRCADQL